MESVEVIDIGKLDKRARQDFKDFSHNGTNSFYREELKAGRLAIFAAIIDGVRIGSVALKRDTQLFGDELVIVAGGGSYQGKRLVPIMLNFLEGLASQAGMAAIRFHTQREPLAIFAQSKGWIEIDDGDPDEICMRKVLK